MKAACVSSLFVVLFSTSMLFAQATPELPKPQKEHEWLKQFEGEWESLSEATAVPGQEPMKCKGTMSSKMLGAFWVVSDVKGDMMGVQVNAIQTIGYDPQAKKYVGTWVDSMMNYLWKYEGTVDKSGKILTLEAEGPNMMVAGKLSKYRDVYEFKSKDEIATKSEMLGDDGKWVNFMKGTVKRKK